MMTYLASIETFVVVPGTLLQRSENSPVVDVLHPERSPG
jgi:hypothetical protein